MPAPIDVYFWPTPNGTKITLACEEMGVDYKLIAVNIGKGDQFKPDFLQISPNNRMPAIGPRPAICQNSHSSTCTRPRSSCG